jgi:hypothetical protein
MHERLDTSRFKSLVDTPNGTNESNAEVMENPKYRDSCASAHLLPATSGEFRFTGRGTIEFCKVQMTEETSLPQSAITGN